MIKYIDEFGNNKITQKLVQKIGKVAKKLPAPLSLMEVCGTHTMAMFRYGIRKVLPGNIRIISGPGCPVCVTSGEDIDKAIALSECPNTIVTSFGDMLRVPGTNMSLAESKSQGADVRIVYSMLEALDIARRNAEKKVVHLAIGFETTAPTSAAVLKRAKAERIHNFFIFAAHKVIPPALKMLISSPGARINGFILPGHVSTIIGAQPYAFLVQKYKIPCVVAGFEAADILQAILMLLMQTVRKEPKVEIQYKRCVRKQGNVTAQRAMSDVFKVDDVTWRGLRTIRGSGLSLRREFACFDAERHFPLKIPKQKKTACRCGDVLQGKISPLACSLFRVSCTPQSPLGPCMVSSEGTCAAYYKYGGNRE